MAKGPNLEVTCLCGNVYSALVATVCPECHRWPPPDPEEVIKVTEDQLRDVFGHKCDQPNCPVCSAGGQGETR